MAVSLQNNDDVGDRIYEMRFPPFRCMSRFCLHNVLFRACVYVQYSLGMIGLRHWSYFRTGVKSVSIYWFLCHMVAVSTRTSFFCWLLSSELLFSTEFCLDIFVQYYDAFFEKEWTLFQVIDVDITRCRTCMSALLFWCVWQTSSIWAFIFHWIFLDIHSSVQWSFNFIIMCAGHDKGKDFKLICWLRWSEQSSIFCWIWFMNTWIWKIQVS